MLLCGAGVDACLHACAARVQQDSTSLIHHRLSEARASSLPEHQQRESPMTITRLSRCLLGYTPQPAPTYTQSPGPSQPDADAYKMPGATIATALVETLEHTCMTPPATQWQAHGPPTCQQRRNHSRAVFACMIMCTCMHTRRHACLHAGMHTCMYAHFPPLNEHSHTHACMHAHTKTHLHRHTCMHMHAYR